MENKTGLIIARVTMATGATQREIADAAGVSLRTAQRWVQGGAALDRLQLKQLAAFVHPADAGLAAEMAALSGETLESLGLEKPPAPPPAPVPAAPPPPAGPQPPADHLVPLLVDGVLWAISDGLGLAPAVVRPALLVGIEKAAQAHLTMAQTAGALRGYCVTVPR